MLFIMVLDVYISTSQMCFIVSCPNSMHVFMWTRKMKLCNTCIFCHAKYICTIPEFHLSQAFHQACVGGSSDYRLGTGGDSALLWGWGQPFFYTNTQTFLKPSFKKFSWSITFKIIVSSLVFQSRVYLGMSTLKELILKRPSRQYQYLNVLLNLSSHEKEKVNP